MMRDWFPYGLDAPSVVRNLALIGLGCWILFALSIAAVLPAAVATNAWIWPALSFSLAAVAMVLSSRYGKLRRRERLLDTIPWRGDERVLDIGCGRGLMAVAAARRVPRGAVIGVDIWQAVDLSGNGPEGVASNAMREGVAGRIATRTADMRELPFDTASIDVVISATAIHNVYERAGRERALGEIARVLKPGGRVLIDDIRHLPEYVAQLRRAGFSVGFTRDPRGWFWRIVSFGSLAPGTLLGQKPAV